MSRVGGGGDRLVLKQLKPSGKPDGDDHPELDDMIGGHTGISSGLNIGKGLPGYEYVWIRNEDSSHILYRHRGGTPVLKDDEDYAAGSVYADYSRPSSVDSTVIHSELALYRIPIEAIRRRREEEQAKSEAQLRSGAEEFVSQATPAEIATSGNLPTRFASRRHRMDLRVGPSEEHTLVEQWTPDKGIVDEG